MKPFIIIALLLSLLFACGRESSPDGRSQLRDEVIQNQIDSLKNQNKAMLDSIYLINKQLKLQNKK